MAPERPSNHNLMADLSDVENAVVNEVINALYPNGTSEDSIAGVTCRVYRGWPSPAALNSDLAAGIVNVTVFPATAPDEVLDPYFDASSVAVSACSLTITVIDRAISLAGEAASNQIVGVLVDGKPYIYRVIDTDTTDSVAANLAAMIRDDFVVLLSHSSFTVAGSQQLTARVVAGATISRGFRRQRREVQVSCWSPAPLLRDSISMAIDARLASRSFIDIPDGTKTHIRYVATQIYDQSLSAHLYRRDLSYKCEYTMITRTNAPVMLFGDSHVNNFGIIS